MTRQYRRFDDDDSAVEGRGGLGLGSIVLATALGVGIGMLAAPDTGTVTRRRLRRRMSELGTDLEEGLEGVQEYGGRARERMRARLERLRAREAELDDEGDDEEDEESRALGTILAMAAGVAATYFFSSDRAAPARARARDAADTVRRRAGDAADTVRRRASDRWERFQQQRASNGPASPTSQTETSSGSLPSDEAPRGS